MNVNHLIDLMYAHPLVMPLYIFALGWFIARIIEAINYSKQEPDEIEDEEAYE